MSDEIAFGLNLTAVSQLFAWALLVVILFATIAPISLRPRTITQVNVDRALAFAAMSFFFVLGFPGSAIVAGIACTLGAGLSELLQLVSPSRHARLPDATAKAVGAALGALMGGAVLAVSRLLVR